MILILNHLYWCDLILNHQHMMILPISASSPHISSVSKIEKYSWKKGQLNRYIKNWTLFGRSDLIDLSIVQGK